MYRAVDTYEGYEILGEFELECDAIRATHERIDDTDGECAVYVERCSDMFVLIDMKDNGNEELGRYKSFDKAMEMSEILSEKDWDRDSDL